MPALVFLIAVGALGAAAFVSLFVHGGPGDTFEADIARFAPDDPVFVSSRQFYIVRLSTGSVVALDTREGSREDQQRGCVIRYRETLQAAGRTGLFRGDCTGTLYDLTGAPIDGAGPPMKRHPVTVSSTTVKVDVKTCTDGATGRVVACTS